MFWATQFGSTRAGLAIKAGASAIKILGVPTVRIEPVKIVAEGQCCGVPYATEYVSSRGASVHVWLEEGADEARLAKVVSALLYWKDVIILTWSTGEPLGYRTYYRLDERIPDQKAAANEQAIVKASGY